MNKDENSPEPVALEDEEKDDFEWREENRIEIVFRYDARKSERNEPIDHDLETVSDQFLFEKSPDVEEILGFIMAAMGKMPNGVHVEIEVSEPGGDHSAVWEVAK